MLILAIQPLQTRRLRWSDTGLLPAFAVDTYGRNEHRTAFSNRKQFRLFNIKFSKKRLHQNCQLYWKT